MHPLHRSHSGRNGGPGGPAKSSLGEGPASAPRSADGVATGPSANAQGLFEKLLAMSLRARLQASELEAATGLAGHELDLIAILEAAGPTSVKNLVADLALPRSTMTAIIDRLEARGLVLRHPNPADRRSIVLEATPAAREAFRPFREAIAGIVAKLDRDLDAEERAALVRSIEKLGGRL